MFIAVGAHALSALVSAVFPGHPSHACSESPPEDPEYRTPLQGVALFLVPCAVMVIYQVIATVVLHQESPTVPNRVRWAGVAVVGTALWLVIGRLLGVLP